MTMFLYGLRKYGIAIAGLLLIFGLNYKGDHNFNDSMSVTVYAGFFIWLMSTIFFMIGKSTARLGIANIVGAINGVKLLWYVVSLKPLRRFFRRLRYGTILAKPYPFLALYGSLLDTFAMKRKFTLAPFTDKAPAARAALWRLMARGVIGFAYDANQQPGICVLGWRDTPSSGLDQGFEHALYRLMLRCGQPGQIITPQQVYQTITAATSTDDDQFLFADLLNTGIAIHSYSRADIANIFGMKRFLKKLPSSYNALAGTPGLPELSKIWREYMAYAYLFGIERSTFAHITRLLPATDYQRDPLLYMLQNSEPHAQALQKMMGAVGRATPVSEDVVVATKGLLAEAWHVDEIYDI